MTQINTNINQYNVAMTAQEQNKTQVRIPAYYNVPTYSPKSTKEVLEENPAYQMLMKPFIEHPLEILGTWLGLGVALDIYSTHCRGKYEDSLLKKAASIGDNIEESKFIQNKPMQMVGKGIGKLKNGFAKIVQKSAILRAMRDTHTKPEWEMCKTQAFTHKQEVCLDFNKIMETLKINDTACARIKDLGLEKNEIDYLKKTYNVKALSELSEDKVVNHTLLKRLGKSQNEISSILNNKNATQLTKDEILKTLGMNAEKVKLIKEDIYGKYVNDVEAATKRAGSKIRIGAGDYSSRIGKYLTKPFQRVISCDEIHNKLHSMNGGAKTATGRFTAKMMQMVHRGLTFGQGKLATLIFIAPILVELGLNIKKADKDQKVGTAANGFVDNIAWVFTFPLAFKMMHSLGGIKYAGMTKKQVEEYRKIKEDFNKRAGSGLTDRIKNIFSPDKIQEGEFKTKKEYYDALKETKKKLNAVSTVKGQNIFTRAMRKIAGFITLDLENFKGYSGGNFGSKIYHGLPHLAKDFIGIPMRFGIWGLISMGLLGGILTKCVSSVFGKPYDSMKQDELKENKKAQKQFLKDDLNKRIYALAEQKQHKKQVANKKVKNNNFAFNGLPEEALTSIEQKNQAGNEVDNYTYIPSQKNVIPYTSEDKLRDNYSYIPSSQCKIKSDKISNENTRRYIPSQTPPNFTKTFDNSGLQSALDRADKAESQALKILSGNFEGCI